MKIHHLMLENLPERYTEMSNLLINEAFGEKLVAHERLGFSNMVTSGKVLDSCGTIYAQSKQMGNIAKLFNQNEIEDGDVFFTSDFWHHNFCSIPYMAMLNKVNIVTASWCHAGSWTNGDFMNESVLWGGDLFELAMFNMYDMIFVGTNYHKNSIIERLIPDYYKEEAFKKIIVTGNPFSLKYVYEKASVDFHEKPPKDNQLIIWPHRFDLEKNPNEMLDIMELIMDELPEATFCICTSRIKLYNDNNIQEYIKKKLQRMIYKYGDRIKIITGITKKEYYNLLLRAKVFLSTTIEENFGYCLVEACSLDCHPVAVNNYSHPEILRNNKNFLYDNIDEACELIKFNLLREQEPVSHLVDGYRKSANYMNLAIEMFSNGIDLSEIQKKIDISRDFLRTPEPLIGRR